MNRFRFRLAIPAALAALIALLSVAPALAARDDAAAKRALELADWASANPESCALLDDQKSLELMDGLLLKLAVLCDRADLLGFVAQEANEGPGEALGVDVRANDPSGDAGSSRTQSETSVAYNETTGTFCSGYNDSYHGVTQGLGYTGYSRSTDGGASWSDRGALSASSFGDPALVWRRVDGKFYMAALSTAGLGIWRSDDDCQSFVFVATIASGSDDKELMAVDNNPANPNYGRLYVAWTDFGSGARIYETHSSDGGATWSTQLALSGSGVDVQGAWPTVAPNGDVWVAWVRWNPYPSGPIDIEVARSTNGGGSFSLVSNPMTGQVNPRASGPTGSCGRPALNGNIRYLPSPQIAVGPDGAIHVVYTYDPDGFNTGDVVNAYYRRSTNNGTSWGTEVQLNTVGTNDQFQPSLSVGPNNIVSASWYDRRDDGGNLRLRYYQRMSFDGGVTFDTDAEITDADSPVVLDPNLAACYHGDYDTQTQTDAAAMLVWSDDRATEGGGNNPDVWTDTVGLSDDFLVIPSPGSQDVCSGTDALIDVDVPSFSGFTNPVTLSVTGEPAGTTTGFSVNPVTPPGSSVLTVGNTGSVASGTYTLTITGTSGMITHDGNADLVFFDGAPGAPTLLSPPNGATGLSLSPTLTWTAVAGATDYLVEVDDDAGFGSPEFTGSTSSTSIAPTGLSTLTLYNWRVTASNICGDGSASSVFTFTTGDVSILLVDDDDNSPDVRSTYTTALDNLGYLYDIWDTANSDTEPNAGQLSAYTHVVWFTGDEFGGFAGPGAAGEAALATYLDAGGCLFLSSQDYHFDRGLTSFMQTYLGVSSVSDDSGNYTSVTGAGSIFGGLGPYTLSYPFTDFSDTVTGDGTGELAFDGNNGNDAGLDKFGGAYSTVFLVYPWEAISNGGDRETVLQAALDACGGGPTTFTLTAAVVGSGTMTSSPAGINCPGDCTEDFPEGTMVDLTPTPAAGWMFSAWSGDCTGSGACTVTMDQARSVTATFVEIVWTLDVAVTGPGTVTSSPAGINCPGDCTEDFPEGTLVGLTATPGPDAYLVAWGGDCSGTGACNVTMTANRSVTAEFDTMPFLDGFESGDTSAWSSAVP